MVSRCTFSNLTPNRDRVMLKPKTSKSYSIPGTSLFEHWCRTPTRQGIVFILRVVLSYFPLMCFPAVLAKYFEFLLECLTVACDFVRFHRPTCFCNCFVLPYFVPPLLHNCGAVLGVSTNDLCRIAPPPPHVNTMCFILSYLYVCNLLECSLITLREIDSNLAAIFPLD